MKRTLIAAAGLALATVSGLAGAASWNVVAPGAYGRVDVGGYAQPPVVYSRTPVIAVGNIPAPRHVRPVLAQPPVYLWVPGYQRAHWSRYCSAYGACNVPVYFVEDRWYHEHVMQRPFHDGGYRQH